MHPLTLYQKLLCNRFTDTDRSRVDAWIRDFPYFALPYMVKAKDQSDPKQLLAAALYSADRGILQHYIEGPMQDPEKKLADLPIASETPARKVYPNVENALFSVVDFDSWEVNEDQTIHHFGIHEDSDVSVNAFKEWDIRVRTLKCLSLLGPIRRQLVAYGRQDTDERPDSIPGKAEDETQAIIDRFLESPIRFQPPTPGQEYKPDSSAMVSVQENDEMVSETLAKIHLSQNNPKEATRIYQKLSLLFPEKSSYFEAQIKQIKEKQ